MSDDHELGEEVVLKRRIEERIERLEKGDRPWLRKIIGWMIIVLSLATGWKLLTDRSQTIENGDPHEQNHLSPGSRYSQSTLGAVAHCFSEERQAQIALALTSIQDDRVKAALEPTFALFQVDPSQKQTEPSNESLLSVHIQSEPSEQQKDSSARMTHQPSPRNISVELKSKSLKSTTANLFGSFTIQNESVQVMRWTLKAKDLTVCAELLCSGAPALVCQCSYEKKCE